MNFHSANQYVVDSLVRLSEQREVSAAEDIFDDRGTKLWAKGNRVSKALQERLLQRKLAKPLETALTVEDALSFSDIVHSADQLMAENTLLKRIAGAAALGLLRSLESFPIPPPVRLLLTSAKVNELHTYRHTVFAVLVSAGIAHRLGASDHDAQTLMVAALLHDVGEMYINPDYLKGSNRLEPHEWKHVASHPRIGELLIREMTTLPATVAQIVGQHHERHDGSGYPGQVVRTAQHRLSSWLAVADTAGAILAQGDRGAPQRVALALRMVPEEFDRDAVGATISALREGEDDGYGKPGECACITRALNAAQHIDAAIAEIDTLGNKLHDPLIAGIATTTHRVLGNLGKSLRATGAVETDQLGDAINDPELLSEICLVTREAVWRLRSLARNIYLRAENSLQGPSNLALLAPLIALLNGADEALPSCGPQ